MTTKVQGGLKGLKCISHIFRPRVAHFCTFDVKHVTRIGWERPSTNALSLVLISSFNARDSLRRLLSTSFGSTLSSPSTQVPGAMMHMRWHSKSATYVDALTQESPRPTRHSRRNHNLGLRLELPSRDATLVLKQSQMRKSKDFSGGGSTRNS
ncbi:hypothetical protein ACJRO7_031259 [Eucalyptus globulus]|uniref:Uncharacterized protein n=1 Tax=Eucalyptus globulus TaxID=34317 RepID=A0ABD3JGA8_EUCGL